MAYDKKLSKSDRNKIKSGRRFAKQVGDRQAERLVTSLKQAREKVSA